jgi:hypothetical protein
VRNESSPYARHNFATTTQTKEVTIHHKALFFEYLSLSFVSSFEISRFRVGWRFLGGADSVGSCAVYRFLVVSPRLELSQRNLYNDSFLAKKSWKRTDKYVSVSSSYFYLRRQWITNLAGRKTNYTAGQYIISTSCGRVGEKRIYDNAITRCKFENTFSNLNFPIYTIVLNLHKLALYEINFLAVSLRRVGESDYRTIQCQRQVQKSNTENIYHLATDIVIDIFPV